jgi:hypothetical protein
MTHSKFSLLLHGNWTTCVYCTIKVQFVTVTSPPNRSAPAAHTSNYPVRHSVPVSGVFSWTLLTVHLWKGILLLHIQNASFNCWLFLFTAGSFKHILTIKTSPTNSHINSVHNSTISDCYCIPPSGNWPYIVFSKGRPQMQPVSFSHSCPRLFLNILYTCPVPQLNVICFAVGLTKLFATHWTVHTELSVAWIQCMNCVEGTGSILSLF